MIGSVYIVCKYYYLLLDLHQYLMDIETILFTTISLSSTSWFWRSLWNGMLLSILLIELYSSYSSLISKNHHSVLAYWWQSVSSINRIPSFSLSSSEFHEKMKLPMIKCVFLYTDYHLLWYYTGLMSVNLSNLVITILYHTQFKLILRSNHDNVYYTLSWLDLSINTLNDM